MSEHVGCPCDRCRSTPPRMDIPSSTPCDNCGNPASHIGSTGVEEYVWCDDCDARGYPSVTDEP